MLYCNNCQSELVIKVIIEGLFANLAGKVTAKSVQLATKNISQYSNPEISYTHTYRCNNCGKNHNQDEVLLQCSFSRKYGTIDKFVLVQFRRKDGKDKTITPLPKLILKEKFEEFREQVGEKYTVISRKVQLETLER